MACSMIGMLRLGLALLALAAAAPSATAKTSLVLEYDLRFGPIRLLEMEATVDIGQTDYDAATEMRTVGLAGILFPWTVHTRSTGVRAEDAWRPAVHRSEGTFRGQSRRVELDYGDAGAVVTRIEPPPESDWRDAVPQDLQNRTVDPLSASLSIAQRDCRGSVPVFDGRRRYNLNLTDMGNEVLEQSSHRMFAGSARRCRAVVEALAGFWNTDPRQSETPTTLDFWVASPASGLPAVPVYLELSSSRGTLKIHLTEIRAS